MNTIKKRKESGFTIIEVVLVLAIAGLIFLVVFLALPQLQRSRRDTQRRSDVGRVLAELENFAANNNGAYPGTTAGAGVNDCGITGVSFGDSATSGTYAARYLAGISFDDPSTGSPYTFECDSSVTTIAQGIMQYGIGHTCNGELFSAATGNNRDIAIRVPLEAGETFYCSDNQ